jgi:hypothetical protein
LFEVVFENGKIDAGSFLAVGVGIGVGVGINVVVN